MPNNAVVAIGSNIEPDKNIPQSLLHLAEKAQVLDLAPHLTTEPIGITNQAAFVNTAVRIATQLEMAELKLFLKEVEDRMGRDRSRPKFGPREIDLDILAWNNVIVDEDYYSRPFLQELYHSLKK